MTRDNPGRRCEDGDRGWSRYERPLDAVNLTECAGTAALPSALGTAITERLRLNQWVALPVVIPSATFLIIDRPRSGPISDEAAPTLPPEFA